MIGRMLDISHTRSTTDAVWFYAMSLVVLAGFSTVLVHFLSMVGVVSGVGSFFEGGSVHTLIGTGFVLLLSTLILTGRKLTGDLLSILLVAVGVYLSYTTSIVLGMVPIALLTTIGGHK